MAEKRSSSDREDEFGWYLSFALIAVVTFFAFGAVTGQEALAAAARVLWNGFALIINATFRMFGGLLALIAKGVGWRRVTRIANVIGGIGLSYAASVVLSDDKVQMARGWRGKLRATVASIKYRWQRLHLGWKLVIVAVIIASQIYLHTMLIVFPIGFLVPVVRRLWIRVADMLFGSLYWRTFGTRHRKFVAWLRKLPGVRGVIGWARVTRIRYLAAWRLWKYHPRYLDPETGRRVVSLSEPLRLWWRGELDGYIGRPLLAGGMHQAKRVTEADPGGRPRRQRPPHRGRAGVATGKLDPGRQSACARKPLDKATSLDHASLAICMDDQNGSPRAKLHAHGIRPAQEKAGISSGGK